MTMKTLDRYTYRITWSEEDGEFVGLCAELPSLSWLAPTQEAALKGIRKVVQDAVKDMAVSGEKIPDPLSARTFSGQLRVRIPPALHRQLAVEAAERRSSLNRVIIDKLAHG
jgi:predicted HicB family RNase H-like nuclease